MRVARIYLACLTTWGYANRTHSSIKRTECLVRRQTIRRHRQSNACAHATHATRATQRIYTDEPDSERACHCFYWRPTDRQMLLKPQQCFAAFTRIASRSAAAPRRSCNRNSYYYLRRRQSGCHACDVWLESVYRYIPTAAVAAASTTGHTALNCHVTIE